MGLLESCDLKDLTKGRGSTTGRLEGGVPGTGHSPATQAGRRERFWCVWGTAGKQGSQEHQEMGSEDSRQGKVTRVATGPSWRLGSTANKMGAIVTTLAAVWRTEQGWSREADAAPPLT